MKDDFIRNKVILLAEVSSMITEGQQVTVEVINYIRERIKLENELVEYITNLEDSVEEHIIEDLRAMIFSENV